MSPIARFSLVALDCPDPEALAAFYGAITGWSVAADEGDADWVELTSDRGATLAFQLDPDHRPPAWPDGAAQQAHLDFDVDDLDEGERQVLALGAVKTEVQPKPHRWRVYLDPAGHPFCLVRAESEVDRQ